ncbi:putative protein N(5)-glutamine methyltransferase [Georgenia sp. EYE_87]|uniref:putative protein N(5)-glutamine methyltransferase n=1 Tax=Georgenia sp. EYE_87 TaxID=2853448 RepID=UPI002005195B|nr:putative protein N(5)-glutamine methyltransferase [Georgenia sp. EYE_87]
MPPPVRPGQATTHESVRARLVRTLRAAGCVFAEDEAVLLQAAARTPAELDALLARRVDGVPLEHVLGWAEFCGLRILLDDGVFVPRRRTELLVREGAAHLRRSRAAGRAGRPVVVDLCCGSGAVGAAVAALAGDVELHATDIDAAAVACARRNVAGAGGAVHHGDLYAPLPRGLAGRVDLLVVNAPYVPSAAIALMAPEARLHEPRAALDGGADGLDVHRRVAAGALTWLGPDGVLLIETSAAQARATVEAVERHGLSAAVVTDDSLGATAVVGRVRQ